MFTFKGEAGYSDIPEVTLEVGLANHGRAGDTMSAAFPELFSGLWFSAGHGIKCSRKLWKEDFEVRNSSQIFLYTRKSHILVI